MTTTDVSTASPAYWEPLWSSGRRYRRACETERRLTAERLGPGLGRPALDIGCGDGALARYLQHGLGYRTTGVDCSPSAIALATATVTAAADDAHPGAGFKPRLDPGLEPGPRPGLEPSPGPVPGPSWVCLDFASDSLAGLPDPAYSLLTCRLVYRWIVDKPAFLSRIRSLLAPGGTFWVVTEIAGRRTTSDPFLLSLGISPADAELLTSGWSAVHTADLDVLRCYALRP
ncbi:class I SAM-dependent methyltransferase [Streptomyces sp. NPDC048659]|uniref:class I SAM-dependent methyltransferase n=1 Tax=Streptomyces sp. NPDC048659 TaxID=3155489 RepID=UPI00341DBA53